MDCDLALPPHLRSDPHNALNQNSNVSEEPSKKVSDKPKKLSHSDSRRISTMMNLMNLVFHLLNLKNMLIRVDLR